MGEVVTGETASVVLEGKGDNQDDTEEGDGEPGCGEADSLVGVG